MAVSSAGVRAMYVRSAQGFGRCASVVCGGCRLEQGRQASEARQASQATAEATGSAGTACPPGRPRCPRERRPIAKNGFLTKRPAGAGQRKGPDALAHTRPHIVRPKIAGTEHHTSPSRCSSTPRRSPSPFNTRPGCIAALPPALPASQHHLALGLPLTQVQARLMSCAARSLEYVRLTFQRYFPKAENIAER